MLERSRSSEYNHEGRDKHDPSPKPWSSDEVETSCRLAGNAKEAANNPMKFPDTWPSDCPPGDALDAEGTVFRIVNHNPPAAEDFVTSFESGAFPSRPACLRCGLSVHRILADAIHTKTKYPKLGSWIAQGMLTQGCGKTKQTGQASHTTWWICAGVDRASIFTCIAEES